MNYFPSMNIHFHTYFSLFVPLVKTAEDSNNARIVSWKTLAQEAPELFLIADVCFVSAALDLKHLRFLN